MFLGKNKIKLLKFYWSSKALINSYISHDEFVSVNNTLKECNEIKKAIKIPETSVEYTI